MLLSLGRVRFSDGAIARSLVISDNSTASIDSGIEPLGVLPDMAFLEPRRFAPGMLYSRLLAANVLIK